MCNKNNTGDSMGYCKNCGAELEEGSVFCNECGYKLNGKPQNNSIFNMYDIEMIEGEEIIKKSEINTACLIVPTILTVFGVIIWIIEMVNLGPYGFVTGLIFNPILIVGVIWLIIRFIAYKNTDLILTNKRVFGKCGLISTVQMQSPIVKIDTVSFSNGLIGKALGYGTIIVSTTSSHFKFRFINNAHELSNYIFHQLEINDKEMIEKQAEAIAKAVKD